ncbi:EamA family transporter [Candidatus Roizmanbacteria bacterium]|nr:EamA family transporter [Candidatus Roizmanbacteria bacterium]
MRYVIFISSIALAVIGQILLKRGIQAQPFTFQLAGILKTLFSPLVLGGFVLYGLSSLLWLLVLQKFPLHVASPLLSLSYVLLFVYGVFFLKEPISPWNYAGLGFIVVGAILVAWK